MLTRIVMIIASTAAISMATGCGLYSAPYTKLTTASKSEQAEYQVITMDRNIGYLIDPRTESCLLVYANTASSRVDCQKLKKNVPEATKFITWNSP